MAPRIPQHGRPLARGEDFTNALDEVPSDAEGTGDEDVEVVADPPVGPASLLVPPEPSRIKVPKPGSSAQEYHVAVMHFQVENGTLRELIAKLFAENDSLREQLGSVAAHTNTVSVSSARNSALGWTAEWNNFARQYLFLVAPWLPNAAFGVVARPAIDPISSMRYENEEAKRAAEAAELYDLIPRKYHPIISRADSGFASVFRKKLQGARSNLLATLITHAGRIFNMPAAIFNRNASSLREEDPTIQRLIRDADGNYGTFARVLFPIEEDKIEIKHIFLSEYLVMILQLMLFGPQSIGVSASGTTMGQAPVGKKWRITRLTPGLLALGGLFLIYILSADTALQHNKLGDKTVIDYMALFDTLKRIYICLSPERRCKVDNYFAQHLFHIAPPPAPPSEAGPSLSIEDGLLAINEPSIVLDNEPGFASDVPSVDGDSEPHDEHDYPVSLASSSSSTSPSSASQAIARQHTAYRPPLVLPPAIMPVPTPTPTPVIVPVPARPSAPAIVPVPVPVPAPAIVPVPAPPRPRAPAIVPAPMTVPAPAPATVPAPAPAPPAIMPLLPPAIIPVPTVASSSLRKGKTRVVSGVDSLSSAVSSLAIEAYAPCPVTLTTEDAESGESTGTAAVRRGRSAAKGKAKEIVLTPILLAPVAGDTPQVPVAPPPPKRKRRQQP
ncbi:hypothetical protein FOMPIDRAFT_89821 [Fomitopsis schrenkii]|uniref:Uncharacterized protein n=1 Tax=Fomitopsis schrenkii TaxID=2126942 RepID=S8DZ45_FOMSC|nr:hypothetical protein FOMPIDRAFT_89821 [Fomitopsis schrenkii]